MRTQGVMNLSPRGDSLAHAAGPAASARLRGATQRADTPSVPCTRLGEGNTRERALTVRSAMSRFWMGLEKGSSSFRKPLFVVLTTLASGRL